jgi:tetratricopeptide (TPR) repeat protein
VAADSLNPNVLAQVGSERWWTDRDPRAASVALERALAIDSLNEAAIYAYADLLKAQSRDQEAAALLMRAWRANPYSTTLDVSAASAVITAGHRDVAERQCERAMALDSARFGKCRYSILWTAGALPEALAACRAWQPAPSMCGAMSLGRLGRRAEALQEAALMEKSWEGRYVRPSSAAAMWAWAGDLDRAMAWLDREERNHGAALAYLGTTIQLKPLHGDPRFEALLKRVAHK